MLRPLVAACALSLLAPSGALAAQGNDVAWLVPADTTVLVRLDSARAWNELVRAFAPLAGEQAARHDLLAVLGAMAAPGTKTAELDPARPLYLAVSLDAASGAALTLVAPVTNGQPLQIQTPFGPTTSVARGGYTGISNHAGYGTSATPSPLLAALRPGLVSAYVDLKTLVTAFRPLIDMGLDQAEMALDQAPSDDVPFDVQPLMETYLEVARSVVASAESLDLAFERRGDELALRLDYLEREERAPAGATADVTPLLGYVDPASSVQLALNGKWTEYFAFFESMTDSLLEVYPEPLRTDLSRLLALQDELDPLLLPGLVVGFDFGTEGLHGSYVMRSNQPAELETKLEGLLRELDHAGGLLRVGAAERLVVEGLEARVLPLEIQHESLLSALADMSGAAGGLPPDGERQFRETMETLYGRNLRLALVRQGELLAVCLAGNDAELRADVARMKTPAGASPQLLALLAHVAPGKLGFAYHLDFGRSMGQVVRALQGVLPGPGVFFPDQQASFGFWGSTGGRTWSGGMVLSFAELIRFVQAMKDLQNK